ncbi:MAG TPA: DUF3108 domain-containing protein [Candidatus Binatia bacterium]|nr:DUF3108 domain-containing protein [Candidatus Binatia bacterium]
MKVTRHALYMMLIFQLVGVSVAGQSNDKPAEIPSYQPKFYPFDGGEKAVYRATWNGITVATTEVFTTPVWMEGKKFYQVKVDAKTSKALDLIWKMRDTISSTFEAKTLSPSRFVFNQRENSRVVDTEAQYNGGTKKWAVNRQQKGKKPRIYEFDSENTLDPITAVYVARSVDFKVGDRLYFNVFGGRYQYLLELAVAGRETIQLESGKVDAFKIVPRVTNLSKSGYAGRLNEAAIWITADARRMPVMLTSKIFVGTVYMEKVDEKPAITPAAVEPRVPAS